MSAVRVRHRPPAFEKPTIVGFFYGLASQLAQTRRRTGGACEGVSRRSFSVGGQKSVCTRIHNNIQDATCRAVMKCRRTKERFRNSANINIRTGLFCTKRKERSRFFTGKMQNFYYVYILIDVETGTHRYVGLTQNLSERLEKHNSGAVQHTSRFRPWRIQTAIAFDLREKAAEFEIYLKSGSGREFAKRHF